MPWSIFTDGGGQGAAATWADDLLAKIGAPQTAGTEQFVYDWEVSEGGGGKYNPLNQGPVPGKPQLTSTGQQFGGGAADYVSWNAGLTGAVDYLNMPDYSQVRQDLKNNDMAAAKRDLWASPWAGSHYGYGANWSDAPFPGEKTPLDPSGGNVKTTSVNPFSSILPPWLSPLFDFLGISTGLDITDVLERGALMLFGGILIIIGIFVLFKGTDKVKTIAGLTPEGKSVKAATSDQAIANRVSPRARKQARTQEAMRGAGGGVGRSPSGSVKPPSATYKKPRTRTGPAGETPAVDNFILSKGKGRANAKSN